jgi:class 3 adenylate cyclase/predicted ATPase
MQCPRCQHENPSQSKFCAECGAPLAAACTRCGAPLAPAAELCTGCGRRVEGRPVRPVPARVSGTVPPAAVQEGARAERRHLTVMLCDLVGSTELSGRLDPEDLREVVRTYQTACTEPIARFEGHIAQYLGDGLLVYFGYPLAHEDAPQRAARSALGIVQAIDRLNTRPGLDPRSQLAVRIGIHTGLVVVGEIGSREERLALGETPNLAARLQAIAEPNTVVISDATYRLLQGLFECTDLGWHALKGVSRRLHAYQLVGEGTAQTQLDVSTIAGLTPLVGREQELTLLRIRWARVKEGLGQVVLLGGEPGIGKSRLIRELKEEIATEPHTRWECRCSPYYRDSALYPMIDLVQRTLGFGREESPHDKLGKIETALTQYDLAHGDAVALWAALLSIPLPADYPPLNLTPQRQRQKIFEVVVSLLRALAARQPVLFVVEDLHWIDPSMLELLELALDQIPTSAVLLVLAFRPEFRPPWGPRTHLTPLTVNRFAPEQTEVMVGKVTGGKLLPTEVLQQVVIKTDGVPLFVEELTKMVVESGLLDEHADHYELRRPLPPLAIPATLQDSLMARLDRLAIVKGVAQLGAAVGRSFTYELLQAVSSFDEPPLQQALSRLVEAELLYQRGVPPAATYVFKHALVQDAAYQSMLKSQRQQYHQRIAQTLEERFRDTRETQPELLAHHYTEAGLKEPAVVYWQRAGQRAIERSAYVEAMAYLTRGLDVIEGLPDTVERTRHELALQVSLGVTLMVTKGYASPEVERTYGRARELCLQVGETPQLATVLWALWAYYLIAGKLQTALEVAEQYRALAQRAQDPELLLETCQLVGLTLHHLGDLVAARPHLEQGMALYDPERHHALIFRHGGVDTGVAMQTHLALTLWLLGYPSQAQRSMHDARLLAQKLNHPFSQAYAWLCLAWLRELCGERQSVREPAEKAVSICAEHGFQFWGALASMLAGWALVEEGAGEEGIAQMRQGRAALEATGAQLFVTHPVSLLVKAHTNAGRAEEGLTVLGEALAMVTRTGDGAWDAELYRLKGELVLAVSRSRHAEAEACFRQAIDIASTRRAKSLELRAAMSLSRLWERQGRKDAARRLLGELYPWFTEGFETADLKEAKALLTEVS